MRSNYWANIQTAYQTLLKGLKLTLSHFVGARQQTPIVSVSSSYYFEQQKGLVTVQYPHEAIPVPDNGRYRLHNEIDDCIVCDKCAKICPVDCIDIESIKATEIFGKTSDGTPKRIHAAKFDIDMGKCCFCGLCTTVCPTECLTMTKTFDFSEFEIDNHIYSFATMSAADILAKKKELEVAEQKKVEARGKVESESATKAVRPKPVLKPKLSPSGSGKPLIPKAKPVVKPRVEPKDPDAEKDSGDKKPRPVFRPRIPKPKKDD